MAKTTTEPAVVETPTPVAKPTRKYKVLKGVHGRTEGDPPERKMYVKGDIMDLTEVEAAVLGLNVKPNA